MTPEQQKEQFSIAYTHALAAHQRINVGHIAVDEDSIDMLLRRSGGFEPQINLQLKCTSTLNIAGNEIRFLLGRKNFLDLRTLCMIPKILVVLHVPAEIDNWIGVEADHLILRHKAYWKNLRDSPAPPPFNGVDIRNQKIPIQIPAQNLLTGAQLTQFLDTIETEGTL